MTVVIQGPPYAANTNPIIKKDPILANSGSLFLFDFKNPLCFAGGAISGNLSNLVTGAAAGSFVNAGAGLFDSASWGFSNNASIGTNTSNAFSIDLGSQYFTNLNHNYLQIAWLTMPATANAGPNGLCPIFNSSNGANGAVAATRGFELQFTGGGLNSRVQGTYDSGTPANTPVGVISNFSINGSAPRLIQLATHWYLDTDNLWKIRQYLNNTVTGTAAYSPAQSGGNGIQNTGSNLKLFGINSPTTFKVHRVYGESLTTSGRSAAAVIATEWNFARNRYGIAA